MFSANDLEILKNKGISETQITEQLNFFRTGFPKMRIKDIASAENGAVLVLSEKAKSEFMADWKNYLKTNGKIVKFVPASGAATRMFKGLFEFLEKETEEPSTTEELIFFNHIENFPFYEDLNEACFRNDNHSVKELIDAKNYKSIVRNLLEKQGLNYGALPKGLIKFHAYPSEKRTPVQEHLLEGALYAGNANGDVNIHFTVSSEHLSLFKFLIETEIPKYEQRYGMNFSVDFSEQKPSTDTLAADMDNNPFRDDAGNLVFRPGGHGALIENLNDIDADIIFIKNIDNVVPDKMKAPTVEYKKVLAGLLVDAQSQIFDYLKQLNKKEEVCDELIESAKAFCHNMLNIYEQDEMSREEWIEFLIQKFNRPIRICGVVRNLGEPGGGPFLVFDAKNVSSPQILESSQIDTKDPLQVGLMSASTHFNPVDLVCAVRNYQGEKFNLLNYVDKQTGFISQKSYKGKELKALELPGLWNGAMSNWNTIFVEVPIETFNPVKIVNDLLREQHQ